MQQILTALAIFLGEVLIMGAEMWAARYFNAAKPWAAVTPAFIISILGVALLVYGYTFGYQAFKNIWIVSALSIAGILIVEPLVAWLLFHEVPTTGAIIAFALGIIGTMVAVMVK